jgi:hypothetical protein
LIRGLPLLGVAALLAGCPPPTTASLQAWWGPVDRNGRDGFAAGQALDVTGLIHRRELPEAGRDVVEVAIVAGEQPITCEGYADFLSQIRQAQAYIVEALDAPDGGPEDARTWRDWACQVVDGAARDTFGGAGRFRTLHALLETTGGGPASGTFRATPPPGDGTEYLGADLLQPNTYVSRLWERYRHGSGLLPDSDADAAWASRGFDPVTACPGILDFLVEELTDGRQTYPDRAAVALQAGTHRYYHLPRDQQELTIEGVDLQVGVVLQDWQQVADEGGPVLPTLFQQVARADRDFPYEELLLSSLGQPLDVQACPQLGEHLGLMWPEFAPFAEPWPQP